MKMKENEKKKMIDYELQQKKKPRVHKICLTGGPCAGKTTGLAYISEKLREKGYNVFVVPEASTLIGTGGGMVNLSNYID